MKRAFQSHIGAIRIDAVISAGWSYDGYFNPTLVQLE